jgi:hypothetical protein
MGVGRIAAWASARPADAALDRTASLLQQFENVEWIHRRILPQQASASFLFFVSLQPEPDPLALAGFPAQQSF